MISFLGDVYSNKRVKLDIILDNFIFNLESPIIIEPTEFAKDKINLYSGDIPFPKNSKPLAVSLANNHIFDCGQIGLDHTIEYLKLHDISFFGIGTKSNNYNNPYSFEDNGILLHVYGYCCETTSPAKTHKLETCPLDFEQAKEDIIRSKQAGAKVILYIHWGEEECFLPKPQDIILARKMIDIGADVIIGHHAHVIQSKEVYKGKYIYYGVGNFIFQDLNVESHFDGNKFTRMYFKKQSRSNKRSIIIDINEDFLVKERYVHYHDDKVSKLKSTKLLRLRTKYLTSNNRIFNFLYNMQKRKVMINRIIYKKKIPSVKQMLLFFGLK